MPYVHPWLIPLLNLGRENPKMGSVNHVPDSNVPDSNRNGGVMDDASQVNSRRTPECRHPVAGETEDECRQLWCNDCRVLYNWGAVACSEAEFKELFEGWLVIGSTPKG